jgi:hypothetical protein
MSIIKLSFFITFGLYSIIYIITSIIVKNSLIENVDKTSNKLIGFIGIVYLIAWVCLIVTNFINISSPERDEVLDRMFGKYWFEFWLQPAIWITMTQMLRFEKVRKQKFLRIIFSFLFIVTIEQFVILLTSFNFNFTKYREFPFTTMDIIIGICTKIFLFLTIVVIYYIAESKYKTFRSIKK